MELLLCHWLNANKISLNTKKTEYVLFKQPRKVSNFNINLKMDGKKLYPSSYIKYLGVYIDSSLSWRNQVHETALKLQRAIEALSKVRHYVSRPILISVYDAIFCSHMRYACQIWGQRNNAVTDRILKLQKRAVRIITFSRRDSASGPIFIDLKRLKFFDLVQFLNVILIHDIYNGKMPIEICNTFSFIIRGNSNVTRGPIKGMIKVPFVQSKGYGEYSIKYQAIKTWNNVQKIFYQSSLFDISLNTLKSHLMLYYFSTYQD